MQISPTFPGASASPVSRSAILPSTWFINFPTVVLRFSMLSSSPHTVRPAVDSVCPRLDASVIPKPSSILIKSLGG